MMILLPLAAWGDALQDVHEPPPLDTCRPSFCPCCGHPAQPPGERLGIVGHGTYVRHVRGVPSAAGQVLLKVRRFLCRGCMKTISLLPDLLHPRRWWCAWAILWVLVQHLLGGKSERELREELGVDVEGTSWRSPRRWRRQLLQRLWRGWARSLGCSGPASDRTEGTRRLLRLLAQSSAWSRGEVVDDQVVRQLSPGVL